MIRVEQIGYSVGEFALKRVSVEVGEGEYFVLLGPPGSGKSIFLECLCGLNRVESGRIFIGGRDATSLEPRRRGIAYVPQDYALFPHLSVEENIAFGLRATGCGRSEIRERVGESCGMLGIGRLLPRSIRGLSGGERQRVALARGLVLRPRVLLLDEPVSALDESMRQEVCDSLLALHRRLGVTTIHVSHNQEEAFSIADRAGVMNDGELRQVGTMEELLRRPCDEFVARFMRCGNILAGEAAGTEDGETLVQCGEARVRVPGRHEGRVVFVIRPEDVRVGAEEGRNSFLLKLEAVRDFGSHVRLGFGGEVSVAAHVPRPAFGEVGMGVGEKVRVCLPPESLHVLTKSV